MRLYSVYYISVGSSTFFGCCHPTTVITASGTGQPGLLPSALVVQLSALVFEFQLNNESGLPVPEVVITVVGCQHPKHIELPTEI